MKEVLLGDGNSQVWYVMSVSMIHLSVPLCCLCCLLGYAYRALGYNNSSSSKQEPHKHNLKLSKRCFSLVNATGPISVNGNVFLRVPIRNLIRVLVQEG